MKKTPGKFEVFNAGRRYWATTKKVPNGIRWIFWSDHKWPFYHGHYTQPKRDEADAERVFFEWLPFGVKS